MREEGAVPIRVLVVEDSPAMRSFMRAALEDEGMADVTVAANGFEALRLLPRERFDLVVTDINMPDIHGLELLAFIRKSDAHRDTPVLIVSTEECSGPRAGTLARRQRLSYKALRARNPARGRARAQRRNRRTPSAWFIACREARPGHVPLKSEERRGREHRRQR